MLYKYHAFDLNLFLKEVSEAKYAWFSLQEKVWFDELEAIQTQLGGGLRIFKKSQRALKKRVKRLNQKIKNQNLSKVDYFYSYVNLNFDAKIKIYSDYFNSNFIAIFKALGPEYSLSFYRLNNQLSKDLLADICKRRYPLTYNTNKEIINYLRFYLDKSFYFDSDKNPEISMLKFILKNKKITLPAEKAGVLSV